MNLEGKIVTIKVGETDMEVLTDSNGNYYLNQSQVAEVIEVPQSLVYDFLTGEPVEVRQTVLQ